MYLNDVCTIPVRPHRPSGDIWCPSGGRRRSPVGVQVMGPALSERLIFRVAAALERAAPGNGSAP